MFPFVAVGLGYPPWDWGCSRYGCPREFSEVALLGIAFLVTGAVLTYFQVSTTRPPATSLRIDDFGITFGSSGSREAKFAWSGPGDLGFLVHDCSAFVGRSKSVPYGHVAKIPGFGPSPLPEPVFRELVGAIESHGFEARKIHGYGGEFDLSFRRKRG